VKVIIGYVTEVKNEGYSSMRFVLPTTVAPRYTPPGQQPISDGTNVIEHTENSDVPLTINLDVSMNEEIHSVTSPTHSIISEAVSAKDLPGPNWQVECHTEFGCDANGSRFCGSYHFKRYLEASAF